MSHRFIFTPTTTFHVIKSWFSYFHSESPTVYSPHYSQREHVNWCSEIPSETPHLPPGSSPQSRPVCSLHWPQSVASPLSASSATLLLKCIWLLLASEHSQSSASFSEPPLPLLGKSSCSFHVFLIFSSFIEISLTYTLVLVQDISTTLTFVYIAT